ncbi:hypothetical protein EON64_12525 [archaeon]|nr:MAG: hypothetical protein EON64_12525 [archaeon]
MQGFRSLMVPQAVFQQKLMTSSAVADKKILATSSGEKVYDLNYYIKGALAGGICCSITHGALW